MSLTPVCNFRCTYCLPNGNPAEALDARLLTIDEIRRLVAAMAELGVTKIRLTGGEPTLRPDFLSIADTVAATPGITDVAVTTNGYRLAGLAESLVARGVRKLNVSVDSLRAERFLAVTGHDRLPQVLDGVRRAIAAGAGPVKINVVLMNGINDDEVGDFTEWTKREPVHVRFIELMPTADNHELFRARHLPPGTLFPAWESAGWRRRPPAETDGPAEVFVHPDYAGSVGVIRPLAENFCGRCNRLRVTATGELQMCLFGDGNVSLRPFLASDADKDELKRFFVSALRLKEPAHRLAEGHVGATRNLAMMGG